MDDNKRAVIEKKIEKTMEALKKNNMSAFYVENKAAALQQVKSMLQEGATVAAGGSVTLKECGITAYLQSGLFHYLDRAQKLSPEASHQLLIDSFSADHYLMSSNAITENGELYNVDGYSNRTAALLFGPKEVIIVAGYNKIVRNLEQAALRVKTIAAPANALRLGYDTSCRVTGECVSLKQASPELCSGCRGEGRICCNYVISAQQRLKDRIKVIIVGEELGF